MGEGAGHESCTASLARRGIEDKSLGISAPGDLAVRIQGRSSQKILCIPVCHSALPSTSTGQQEKQRNKLREIRILVKNLMDV